MALRSAHDNTTPEQKASRLVAEAVHMELNANWSLTQAGKRLEEAANLLAPSERSINLFASAGKRYESGESYLKSTRAYIMGGRIEDAKRVAKLAAEEDLRGESYGFAVALKEDLLKFHSSQRGSDEESTGVAVCLEKINTMQDHFMGLAKKMGLGALVRNAP